MKEVDIDQAAFAVAEKATVLDVREPGEYRVGHLPGAVNIPMGQLTGRFGEIDRSKPVHVVCASGPRSSATTGGPDRSRIRRRRTDAWIRSGRPVEK